MTRDVHVSLRSGYWVITQEGRSPDFHASREEAVKVATVRAARDGVFLVEHLEDGSVIRTEIRRRAEDRVLGLMMMLRRLQVKDGPDGDVIKEMWSELELLLQSVRATRAGWKRQLEQQQRT